MEFKGLYIIPDSYIGIRTDQQDLWSHSYQILPDNAGGFMVVWVEERYPVDRVFYQRSDSSGQLVDVLSAGSEPGYRSPPLLARLNDGNIVAVHASEFPTPDGFLIRIHDGDSGEVLHEELFAIGGNPSGFPIVLPDPNGGFAVVWEESSEFTGYSSHARWFGFDAEPQGDTIDLSLNGQSMADVSMLIQQDGTLAAVFQSSFQRIAPDGTTLGQQVDLGAQGKSIAELADGSLVVASTDVGQVQIQRLSATGELIGSEILVTDSGDNFNPVVAELSGGGFVVAFSAVCMEGEDTLIASFARRYLADGTPDGDVFQLSGMEADADKARLVALPENGFAALFLDYEHPVIANFVGDINAGVFRESDIIGDQHDDTLTGSVLADTIHGMFGDDALQGASGRRSVDRFAR
jgi:hypothetical protein